MLECVGAKHRATTSVALEFGWVFGYMLLPLVAYFVRHFRYLQLIVSVSEIAWLIPMRKIPESPRWQLTHGRVDEAARDIKAAAQRKGHLTDDAIDEKIKSMRTFFEEEEKKRESQKNETIFDLFKVSRLRNYSLILYFTWFVNAFVYYGLSLNVGDLGGNLFINFFIFAVAELFSDIFCIYAYKWFGRKNLLVALMAGAGLACVLIIPFTGSDGYTYYRVSLAMIGKFFITTSFHVIYLYAAEIYPTTMRQIGVGSCGVAARFGSISAPFVKELVSVIEY